MERIPLSRYTKPFQYKDISAGNSGVVWSFNVPKRFVLFIERMGNNWFPNTYYNLTMDGEIHKVEYTIANIENPRVYSPPLVIKNYIIVEAYNNSSKDHTFAFLIDGFLVLRKYLRI